MKLVGLRGGQEDVEDEVDDEEVDALIENVGIDPAAVEGMYGDVDLADLEDVEIPPFVMRVTLPPALRVGRNCRIPASSSTNILGLSNPFFFSNRGFLGAFQNPKP